MRIEAVFRDPPVDDLPALVARVERLGFDGIAVPEVKQDPFVLSALIASASSTLRVSTAVALAFPRSPTATAYSARTVHDISRGRFALGLGTQVRGHIERRFSTPWTAPVQRLREYIGAVRAVFKSWDHGDSPSFEGEHYRVTLMTPEFSPGPNRVAPIPIHIGAVNTHMLQLAGEACDGVRLHPFCTPRYLEHVVLPSLRSGAERTGRSLNSFEIIGGGFIATGPSVDLVQAEREEARRRVAFYASTRSYASVLELHGWTGLGGTLRRLIAQQRWNDLAAEVSDDALTSFCIAGTYETIATRVAEHYSGRADTLTLRLPADAAHDDVLARAVAELKAIPARG